MTVWGLVELLSLPLVAVFKLPPVSCLIHQNRRACACANKLFATRQAWSVSASHRHLVANMLARSSTLVLNNARLHLVTARAALSCFLPQFQAARTFSSTNVTTDSTESLKFPPDGDRKDAGEFPPLHRLRYLLDEPVGRSQKELITELSDDDVSHLPIVISSRKKWRLAEPGFTLPLREKPVLSDQTAFSACSNGEYLYNVFSMPSLLHLKQFHKQVAELFDEEGRTVDPVILLDSRSRVLVIGLPSYVGLEAPFPAKRNLEVITKLLADYRSKEPSDERRSQVAQRLRAHVVTHGFRKQAHHVSFLLYSLYETVRNASEEEILNGEFQVPAWARPPARTGSIEDSVPVDVNSKGTRDIAQRASNTWQKERRKNSKGNKGTANSKPFLPRKEQSSMADRLRPDNPKLPEARASADEMGIKKPVDVNEVKPDDPSLPEADTFAAQDREAHKPSDDVQDLKEHVPFPTPIAEELGIKKPTES